MTDILYPIKLFKDWLEAKEPNWHLTLNENGINRDSNIFYMISIKVQAEWFGYVDGPRTKDTFEVRVGKRGVGCYDVDLRAPLSFEKIHQFLKDIK